MAYTDLIRIGTGSFDTGAFHRAVQVAYKLRDAGIWDAQRGITINEPYDLHTDMFGFRERQPETLVEGVDYFFFIDSSIERILSTMTIIKAAQSFSPSHSEAVHTPAQPTTSQPSATERGPGGEVASTDDEPDTVEGRILNALSFLRAGRITSVTPGDKADTYIIESAHPIMTHTITRMNAAGIKLVRHNRKLLTVHVQPDWRLGANTFTIKPPDQPSIAVKNPPQVWGITWAIFLPDDLMGVLNPMFKFISSGNKGLVIKPANPNLPDVESHIRALLIANAYVESAPVGAQRAAPSVSTDTPAAPAAPSLDDETIAKLELLYRALIQRGPIYTPATSIELNGHTAELVEAGIVERHPEMPGMIRLTPAGCAAINRPYPKFGDQEETPMSDEEAFIAGDTDMPSVIEPDPNDTQEIPAISPAWATPTPNDSLPSGYVNHRLRDVLAEAGVIGDYIIQQLDGENRYQLNFSDPVNISLIEIISGNRTPFSVIGTDANWIKIRVPAKFWFDAPGDNVLEAATSEPASQPDLPTHVQPDHAPVGAQRAAPSVEVPRATIPTMEAESMTAAMDRITALTAEIERLTAPVEAGTAAVGAQHAAPLIEITTLIQDIFHYREHTTVVEDTELADHLNQGWHILNITVTSVLADAVDHTRIITLQREIPAPTAPITTHAAAEIPALELEPVPVTTTPVKRVTGIPMMTPVGDPARVAPMNNGFPIASAIYQHGLDAVKDAMNARIMTVGQAAYEAAQAAQATIARRPLLLTQPAVVGEA